MLVLFNSLSNRWTRREYCAVGCWGGWFGVFAGDWADAGDKADAGDWVDDWVFEGDKADGSYGTDGTDGTDGTNGSDEAEGVIADSADWVLSWRSGFGGTNAWSSI